MTIETLDYADPISTPGGGPTSGITGAEPGLASGSVSVTSNEPQRVLLLGAGMVTAPTVDFLAVDRGSVGTRCKGEGKVRTVACTVTRSVYCVRRSVYCNT